MDAWVMQTAAWLAWGGLAWWLGYRAGYQRMQAHVAKMLVLDVLRWGPRAVPRDETPSPLRERNP